jgi:hypothetical protein
MSRFPGTLNWRCPPGYVNNRISAAIWNDGTHYVGGMHRSLGFNGRLWAPEMTGVIYGLGYSRLAVSRPELHSS